MRLTFIGATHEVTGSCFLIEACGKRILVDCGMEQGLDIFENVELPVRASDVDMVLLTHAHMDHSGKLPLLYKQGFRGQIFSTEGTAKLCEIMLRDSAHIQEQEAQWKTRKAVRAGREEVQPLYDMNDAEGTLRCFVRAAYDREVRIAEGIRVRFQDAGHLLGSASIEVWIKEGEVEKKIVFSGDIGNRHQPLIKEPHYISEADYVVMESTYGDREHDIPVDYAVSLAQVIQRTLDRGGNVVIPSFAVGRTQDMLYYFSKLLKEDSEFAAAMSGIKVYVDSPMAKSATEIFKRNAQVYDEESTDLIMQGVNPLSFEGLVFVRDVFESQTLNHDTSPKVIISDSGMCEAGRIKHHLKHNLWDPRNSVIFVGYQAEGTLGRTIVDGAQEVKIFGEPIHVAAEIFNLKGFSGHADRNGLLQWLTAFSPIPEKIFLVHGETKAKENFRTLIKEKLGVDAVVITGESTADITDGLDLYGGRASAEQEKYEELTALRKRLADVHHRINHLLYTTTLATDDSMSEEWIQRITDAVMSLEKDTINLGAAVSDGGEPHAYDAEHN